MPDVDSRELEPARPSANDTALLAHDSLFVERLRALGPEGEGDLALDLLRDAHDMLSDPGQHHRPYVIAQSVCRTAIECLMDLGGTNHKALLAARNDLTKSLKPIFQPNGSRKVTKPLARLLLALDAFPEIPDDASTDDGLWDALTSLHRSRTSYRASLPDLAHAQALEQVVDVLDGLGQMPAQLTGKDRLTTVLRELHAVRISPGFRRDAELDRRLESVGSAYARVLEMENAQGSRRIQQVTALVRDLTGREPGAGELKAYKAWSDYYQSASKINAGNDGEQGEDPGRATAGPPGAWTPQGPKPPGLA